MKKKKIKSSWKVYFNFSTRERRGALLLAVILILQISVLYYLHSIHNPLPPADPKIITSLIEEIKKSATDTIISDRKQVSIEKKIIYFNFDPNNMSDSSWRQLGLSEKQFSSIKNYLNHGGRFRIKSDLKKMYCISNIKYDELQPFILLPDSIPKKVYADKKNIREPLLVNIDLADSVTLIRLKGIGPVLASRIIKYREILGGFNSLNQLKEVWGITDSLFQTLIPFVSIQKSVPFRFIHLNTDSFSILTTHPYIRGKIAGLICNYRKQHKSFVSLEELKQLPLITEENFLKLVPYLTLD